MDRQLQRESVVVYIWPRSPECIPKKKHRKLRSRSRSPSVKRQRTQRSLSPQQQNPSSDNVYGPIPSAVQKSDDLQVLAQSGYVMSSTRDSIVTKDKVLKGQQDRLITNHQERLDKEALLMKKFKEMAKQQQNK